MRTKSAAMNTDVVSALLWGRTKHNVSTAAKRSFDIMAMCRSVLPRHKEQPVSVQALAYIRDSVRLTSQPFSKDGLKSLRSLGAEWKIQLPPRPSMPSTRP